VSSLFVYCGFVAGWISLLGFRNSALVYSHSFAAGVSSLFVYPGSSSLFVYGGISPFGSCAPAPLHAVTFLVVKNYQFNSDLIRQLLNDINPPLTMPYDILLSDNLLSGHPTLLPQLQRLFTEDDCGEDINIASDGPPLIPGAKVVRWTGDFDLKGDRTPLMLVWLDLPQIIHGVRHNTLCELLDSIQERYNHQESSQRMLLFAHGTEDLPEDLHQAFTVEMCRLDVHFPCVHRMVETVSDAATCMHVYTQGLLKMIASPTRREVFAMYRAMLMAVPLMTPERVDLVTGRYRNMRALYSALKRLESDFFAGRLALTSAIFSEDEPAFDSEDEAWVLNLFLTLCSDDPDVPLRLEE
ncbi:hypothetical protein V5O48_012523, partial [Marasmius crinis-equi]